MIKWVKTIIIQLLLSIIICSFISELWLEAEINLYGYSQHSAVDSFAAWIMSFSLAEFLMDMR